MIFYFFGMRKRLLVIHKLPVWQKNNYFV